MIQQTEMTTPVDSQLVNTRGGNQYSFVDGKDGAITLDDIAERGMFNYGVEKRPLYDAEGKVVPGANEVIRTDTGSHLGVVGSQYTPLQPRVLLDVATKLGELSSESGNQLTFESAGTVKGGSINYLQLKVPGFMSVLGDTDRTDKYLTLFNGHTGDTQLSVSAQAKRVSCANQIAAMSRSFGVGNRYTLRHTANVEGNLHLLGDALSNQHHYYKLLNEAMNFLTGQTTSDQDAMNFFKKTFRKEDAIDIETQEVKEQKFLALDKLMELRETGLGTDIPGVRGTAYGDYQAVTEYLDHHQRTRKGTDSFYRVNIASEVQRVKSRALDLLV